MLGGPVILFTMIGTLSMALVWLIADIYFMCVFASWATELARINKKDAKVTRREAREAKKIELANAEVPKLSG